MFMRVCCLITSTFHHKRLLEITSFLLSSGHNENMFFSAFLLPPRGKSNYSSNFICWTVTILTQWEWMDERTYNNNRRRRMKIVIFISRWKRLQTIASVICIRLLSNGEREKGMGNTKNWNLRASWDVYTLIIARSRGVPLSSSHWNQFQSN